MDEIKEFEEEFQKFTGARYAIACSSGTTALISACMAIGLKEGQKVITTPFTFIASSTCILHQKAIPVFADIYSQPCSCYNIDPENIEKLVKSESNIVGILPVHLFGQACHMDKIMKIAKDNNLWVIEDCAQAFGRKYNTMVLNSPYADNHVGTIGDIGCFSFYATKNLNCFEGGMITTDNDKLDRKLRMIINHGSNTRYIHEELGYNFRMSRICALIGCTQLRLHSQGAISELGSYGIKNGHYPYVLYEQPLFKKLGITGNCPNAEYAAAEARRYFKV